MPALLPFAEAVRADRRRFSPLIDTAVRWCEGRGRSSDPDLFALVCAAATGFERTPEAFPRRWTRARVRGLLWSGIPYWCEFNRCAGWPRGAAPAVWTWFDFLHGTARLDPAGDPLRELRKPLICHGGLDLSGRLRPAHTPSPIPCECRIDIGYPDAPAGVCLERPPAGWRPATLGRRWTNHRASPAEARCARRPPTKPPEPGGRSGSRPG